MFVKDFENSVHNVLDEDSERLTILQQLLSVDVRRHMARHLHDPALYQQAWNMLETRYGNPALIVEVSLAAKDALQPWRDYVIEVSAISSQSLTESW